MKTTVNAPFMLLALAAAASPQAPTSNPASIPVHNLEIHHFAEDALAVLAERYHVVIGVYGTRNAPERETDAVESIHLSFKDGTLGDVFDAIVRADPRLLQWRTSANGSVHFVEYGPLPLVDITVHSFEAEGLRRMEAVSTLSKIAEVSVWFRDHGCAPNEQFIGRLPPEWAKFAVHAKDVPLSAVLDDIAAKSGTYYWAIQRDQYSSGRCVITVVP